MSKNCVVNKIQEALTKGVTLNQGESSDNRISKYSPNNLKSIVLSPKGAILTFFTTSGSNQNKLIRQITFLENEEWYESWVNDKEVLSFLVGDRVYSSLEEVVIIMSNGPEPMYEMPGRQAEYMIQNLSTKLKRLKGISIIKYYPYELDYFASQYDSVLRDEHTHLIDLEEMQDTNYALSTRVNEDWWKYTNLRPTYYELDEKDGPLATYFNRVKNHYLDIEQAEKDKNRGKRRKKSSTEEVDETSIKQSIKNIEMYVDLISRLYNNNINKGIIRSKSVKTYLNGNINKITKQLNISGVLKDEVLEIAKTDINEFLAMFTSNKEPYYGVKNIEELEKELIGTVVSNVALLYGAGSESNPANRIIAKTLEDYFTKTVEKENITSIKNYLGRQKIPTEFKQEDYKVIKDLIAYNFKTKDEVKGKKPVEEDLELQKRLDILLSSKENLLDMYLMIKDLLYLEKNLANVYTPGTLIESDLVAMWDFLVRATNTGDTRGYTLKSFKQTYPSNKENTFSKQSNKEKALDEMLSMFIPKETPEVEEETEEVELEADFTEVDSVEVEVKPETVEVEQEHTKIEPQKEVEITGQTQSSKPIHDADMSSLVVNKQGYEELAPVIEEKVGPKPEITDNDAMIEYSAKAEEAKVAEETRLESEAIIKEEREAVIDETIELTNKKFNIWLSKLEEHLPIKQEVNELLSTLGGKEDKDTYKEICKLILNKFDIQITHKEPLIGMQIMMYTPTILRNREIVKITDLGLELSRTSQIYFKYAQNKFTIEEAYQYPKNLVLIFRFLDKYVSKRGV